MTASDLAVSRGADPFALIVGASSASPGERSHAVAHRTTDGGTLTAVMLDDVGALESAAYGVDITEEIAVVTGLVTDDAGASRAAVWESTDGGVTFGDPEFPFDGPGLGADVVVVDGAPVVIAWEPTDGGQGLGAAKRSAEGWTTTSIPVEGDDPNVSGVVASGATVIVTGTMEIAGQRVGAAWVSVDSGATFTASTDPALAERTRIGDPIVGGDGFIASSSRAGSAPSSLITTADGLTWRTIEFNIEAPGGSAWTPSGAGSSPLVAMSDGRFAVGVTDQLAAVAIVDANGSGSFDYAPYMQTELYTDPIPFMLGDELFVVGSSRRSFRIAKYQGEQLRWQITTAPAGDSVGPAAVSVELALAAGGPIALARSFPHVAPSGTGGITWSQRERWSARGASSWATDNELVPEGTDIFVTDGTTDYAVDANADDPGDDDLPGPRGGSTVRSRAAGGAWSEPELFFTGPGAEFASDMTPFGSGAIVVGTRYTRSADGVSTSTGAIMELSDSAWAEAAIAVDLGPQSALDDAAVADNGLAAAWGTMQVDDRFQPFLLVRAADGSWSPIAVTDDVTRFDIWDVVGGADSIDILAQDGDDWIRARTTDGVTVDVQPIVVDDPVASFPTALVEVGGRELMIGRTYTMGVSELTVWELDADGNTVEIELSEPQFSRQIDLDSFLVADDHVLVGGTWLGQSVVWELAIQG